MDWFDRFTEIVPEPWRRRLAPLAITALVVAGLAAIWAWIGTIDWLVVAFVALGVAAINAIHILRAKPRPSRIATTSGEPATLPAFGKWDKAFAIGYLLSVALAILAVFVVPRIWDKKTSDRVAADYAESPRPPGSGPSLDEIQDVPTQDQVDADPRVRAAEVNFMYKNSSGIPLRLILYDWYYHYHPIDLPLAPQDAWRTWDFPANGAFSTFSEFERGTGWYSFFVEEVEGARRHCLGTKNIFYAERPTLTVTSTGNNSEPLKADFGREE